MTKIEVKKEVDEVPTWLEPWGEECSVMEIRPWNGSEEYDRVNLWTPALSLAFTSDPNADMHPCAQFVNLGKCYLSINHRHSVVRLFVTLKDDVDVLVGGKSIKEVIERFEPGMAGQCPNCSTFAKDAEELEYRVAMLNVGDTAFHMLQTGRAPWRLIRMLVKEKIATQWRILLFGVRSRCPGLRPRS
jgi:hypothetical protein